MNPFTIDTPVGRLVIRADRHGLTHVKFEDEPRAAALPSPVPDADVRLLEEARRQLDAYFAGSLRRFDLPLAAGGTPFRHEVWRALTTIGFGETTHYGALAVRIGRPRAVRAVGAANGANPISIVVPCHRVIGHDGALTGYSGGVSRKRWLLDHEAAFARV
jgi:methylated-DNA-[protein]-cysteine S-methyltransferase